LISNDIPHSKLILLSDCDPTFGKNPITEASKILDIMLFPNGNTWMAKRMSKEVMYGSVTEIHKVEMIPEILQKIFKK
jgi:hypothetical protein